MDWHVLHKHQSRKKKNAKYKDNIPEQFIQLAFTPCVQVRQELEAVLARLPAPMRVVFSQQMCLACGQEGDPRLMEDRCHRNKVRGHTGDLEQRFTKKQVQDTEQ